MNALWLSKPFRNAEGEGAGGGVSEGEISSPPAPAEDKLTALEERLSRIARSVEGMTSEQRQRKTIDTLARRDAELQRAKADAQQAVADAEERLADAYDNGEGIEIAKAQRALSEMVAKVERADAELEGFRQQVKQAERAPVTEEVDNTNLNSWKKKNEAWYGVDAEMTKAAHRIDRQIRDAGVWSVGTTEYFDAIDREMRSMYPDKFGGTPQTMSRSSSTSPSTPDRGRISKSVADGLRRMGLNVDDPAVAKRIIQHRQTAVEKGILPEQPVQGSIIQR